MRPSALPCASLLFVCRCSVIALLATFAGCGGSSNTTPPPGGSFELSLSANSVSVIAGQQSGLTVSVTPVNGFSGTVSLTISGLPNGVSGSFSPNPVAVGQAANLVLQAQPTAAAQNANLQVTGIAGSLSKNQSLTLTVVESASSLSRSGHTYFDGFAHDVVYDPVHKLVFCANTSLNEVEVVSTTTQTITNVLKIPQPSAVDVTPDGSKLWVGTTGEFFYAVDIASMEVVERITPRGASPPVVAASYFPVTTVRALSTTANGSLLLRLGQVNVTTEALYQYVPSTGRFVDRSKEASAMRFLRSADGSKVLLGSGPWVTVYDSATDTFQSNNTVTGSALAAIRTDGSQIAVQTEAGLAFLNSQLQLLATVSVGSGGGAPVYSRDGKFVYFPEDNSIIRTKPAFVVVDSNTFQMVGELPDLFLTHDIVSCSPIDVCDWTPGGTTLRTSEETGLLIGPSPIGLSFLDSKNPSQLPSIVPRLNLYSPYGANPSAGSDGQSTQVVLSGYQLGGASVLFGNQQAPVVSVSSDQSQLTVASPNSSSAGPVNVLATFADNWLTMAPLAFSYGPEVEYFLPMGDAPSGGSQLTILGYGFGTESSQIRVSIGGSPAQVVGSSFANGTGVFPLDFPLYAMTVIAPSGTSGAADLVVSTPTGSTKSPQAFHYLQSVKTLTLGGNFTHVLYDSTRKYVYLLDPVAKQIQIVASQSSQVVASAPTGNNPTDMTLTPDASILAVVNHGDNTISLINPDNPATPRIVNTSYLPTNLAATSSGKLLLNDGEVIDLSSGASSFISYSDCGATQPLLSSVADGSRVFLATPANSGGGVCVYTAATNSFSNFNQLQDYLSEAAVAGDGSRWVIDDQYILDGTDALEGQLSISPLIVAGTPSAVSGSVLHPSGGLFYLPLLNGLHIYDLVHARLVRSYGGLQLSPGAVKTIALDDLGQTLFAISPTGLQIARLDSVPLSIGNLSSSVVSSSGGTKLTVRGSGFTSNTVVSIAGKVVPSNFVDGNTLQVTLPMLTAGTAPVSVQNPDGSSFALEGVLLVQ